MRRSEEEGPPGDQLAQPNGVSEVGGAGGEQQEAAAAGGGAVLPVVEANHGGRPEELLPFPGLGWVLPDYAGERVMPPSVYQHVQHLLGEAALAEDAVQLLLPEDDAPSSDDELPPLEDMSEDMREADLREDGA